MTAFTKRLIWEKCRKVTSAYSRWPCATLAIDRWLTPAETEKAYQILREFVQAGGMNPKQWQDKINKI